jgi:hypothetical protein
MCHDGGDAAAEYSGELVAGCPGEAQFGSEEFGDGRGLWPYMAAWVINVTMVARMMIAVDLVTSGKKANDQIAALTAPMA